MSDDRVRRLERAWQETKDPQDEEALLTAQLRAGWQREAIERAAHLGHGPALVALGQAAAAEQLPFDAWLATVCGWSHGAAVRAAAAAADAAEPNWGGDRFDGADDRYYAAAELLDEWLDGPSQAAADRLEAASHDPDWEDARAANVLFSATRAVLEPSLASEHSRAALEVVAGAYPQTDTEEEKRRLIRDELVPWLLGQGDPAARRMARHGRRLGREPDIIRAIAPLPDGRRALVTSRAGTISVWDLVARTRVHALPTPERPPEPFAAASAADGRTAVTGDANGQLQVWDLDAGALVTAFPAHAEAVYALLALPDGRVASGSVDRTVRVWRLHRPDQPDLHLEGSSERSLSTLAVSPDGATLAAAGPGPTVHTWDLASGARRRGFEAAGVAGWAQVGFLPDGRLAAVGDDNRLATWEPGSDRPLTHEKPEGTPGARGASAGLILPDGRALSGGEIGVWLRDLATGETLRRWRLPGTQLALGLVPGARTVVCGARVGALRLLDLTTSRRV